MEANTVTESYMPNRIVQSVLKHQEARRIRTEEPAPSQIEKIEAALTYSKGSWVCGQSFLQAYIPTYSQRIGEMIVAGAPILRERCSHPGHNHRSSLGQYAWIKEEE